MTTELITRKEKPNQTKDLKELLNPAIDKNKIYKGLSKEEVLKLYNFAMKKRLNGLGQRKIAKSIKERFNKNISEATISNWIFNGKKPFNNEKTQFKPLPKPKKEDIYEEYINRKISAQKVADKYKTSTVTAIKWIREYELKPRTHLESMNTLVIKKQIRERILRRPTKCFYDISPSKAYILGVLCGDGFISNKTIRFEIRKDEEFTKEFARCIKEVYGLDYKYSYYTKKNTFVLYVPSQIICADLLRYGKFGTFEWNIPKEIMESSDEKNKALFLRGLFDSEGTASKYIVSMTSANKNGIEEVSFLLKSMDIGNKIFTIKNKYYTLYITKRERLVRFRDKIGFTIKRKMEKLNGLKWKN